MAKRVVVTSTLTEEMISAGARLLEHLDKAGLSVQAAMWQRQPESETWRLMLALPGLKSRGPLQSYHRILEVQSTLPYDELTVDVEDISVIDDQEPLIEALKKANRIHPISQSRQPRMVVSGIYLEESYIYRLSEPSTIAAES